MKCTEFESILADYLDGALSPAERATLELHAAECPDCRAFLDDVTGGANLLKSLEPVDPPPTLVTRIAFQAPLGRVRDPFERQSAWSKFAAKWLRPVLQPRLVMGMAMTVLSFSMLERCTGTKVTRIQANDLNPAHIAGGLEMKTVRLKDRLVKYYENLRVVYEVEARLRDLQRQQEAGEKSARALKQAPEKDKK